MTQLTARTGVSDTYPLPSNATAKAALAAIWDVVNEMSQAAEVDIASAATVSIGAQTTRKLRITGTTGITSFGTTYTGIVVLRFAAALTVTHNATTLICPNGVNLTVAAGDIIIASPKATTSGTFDGWIITAANTASEINSLTAKTTPVGGDLIPIIDSAASNVLKKLSFTNLATYLAGLCSSGWNSLTSSSCTGNAATATTAATASAVAWSGVTGKPNIPLSLYDSGNIAYADNSVTTVTHGLGGVPTIMACYLVCVTAESGYSIGDEVSVSNYSFSGYGSANVFMTSTTIGLSLNGTILVMDKVTTIPSYATASKWRLRFIAMR